MSNKKKHMQEERVGCWIMYPTTGLSLRFWRMSTSTTPIPFHHAPPTHLFFSFFPYFSCFPSTFHSFSSSQHYFFSFNSYLLLIRIMREIIHVQAGNLSCPTHNAFELRWLSTMALYSLSHGSRYFL